MELSPISNRNQRAEQDMKNLPQEAKDLLNFIDVMPTMVGAPIFQSKDTWLIVEIAKFIVSEYPKFTLFDIQKAFTMGAKRELRTDSGVVDISTFGQKVSVNSVGKVLAAYTEYKNELRARPSSMFPTAVKAIGPKKEGRITQKDAYHMLIDYVKKDGGEIPEFFGLWDFVYSYVKRKKGDELDRKWGEEEMALMMRRASLLTTDIGGGFKNIASRTKDKEGKFAELYIRRYFKEIVIPELRKLGEIKEKE